MAHERWMTCGYHCRVCVLAISVQESTSVHVGERTWERTREVAALRWTEWNTGQRVPFRVQGAQYFSTLSQWWHVPSLPCSPPSLTMILSLMKWQLAMALSVSLSLSAHPISSSLSSLINYDTISHEMTIGDDALSFSLSLSLSVFLSSLPLSQQQFDCCNTEAMSIKWILFAWWWRLRWRQRWYNNDLLHDDHDDDDDNTMKMSSLLHDDDDDDDDDDDNSNVNAIVVWWRWW